MARRGRPSKAGKRTRSGRLQRDNYPAPAYDHGSERSQERKRRFGTHGTTALGRAYAVGLLGDEQTAKIRRDAGKRFLRAVDRFFEVGRVRCPLGAEMRLGALKIQIEGNPYEEEEWQWICDKAKRLDVAGLRPWLDQLILGVYTDSGPPWLTRLIDGGSDPCDNAMLDAAIKALDVIAGSQPKGKILSGSW